MVADTVFVAIHLAANVDEWANMPITRVISHINTPTLLEPNDLCLPPHIRDPAGQD